MALASANHLCSVSNIILFYWNEKTSKDVVTKAYIVLDQLIINPIFLKHV